MDLFLNNEPFHPTVATWISIVNLPSSQAIEITFFVILIVWIVHFEILIFSNVLQRDLCHQCCKKSVYPSLPIMNARECTEKPATSNTFLAFSFARDTRQAEKTLAR